MNAGAAWADHQRGREGGGGDAQGKRGVDERAALMGEERWGSWALSRQQLGGLGRRGQRYVMNPPPCSLQQAHHCSPALRAQRLDGNHEGPHVAALRCAPACLACAYARPPTPTIPPPPRSPGDVLIASGPGAGAAGHNEKRQLRRVVLPSPHRLAMLAGLMVSARTGRADPVGPSSGSGTKRTADDDNQRFRVPYPLHTASALRSLALALISIPWAIPWAIPCAIPPACPAHGGASMDLRSGPVRRPRSTARSEREMQSYPLSVPLLGPTTLLS